MTTVVTSALAPRSAQRLRSLAVRSDALALKQSQVAAERRQLENEISWSLGFQVPLRGQQLLDEVARADRARRRVA